MQESTLTKQKVHQASKWRSQSRKFIEFECLTVEALSKMDNHLDWNQSIIVEEPLVFFKVLKILLECWKFLKRLIKYIDYYI